MMQIMKEHKYPLLSTGAVSKWLGISQRTICLWAECGEIPALKVGRHWRFREEDLRRWLDAAQEKLVGRRDHKRLLLPSVGCSPLAQVR